MLPPLAERRVLGPDAGVQARVPVQVTKNRPLGTCTAYPGLLERGHGLRQGLGPPAFVPSFSLEFLLSALKPRGVYCQREGAREAGVGSARWTCLRSRGGLFSSPCYLGIPPVPHLKDSSALDTATSAEVLTAWRGGVNSVCAL